MPPEASAVKGVRLSHPDKILYADQGVTKRDLADYYAAAAGRMLPHVANRLVSLVRCPEGAGGECFFQRHGNRGFPREFGRLKVADKHGAQRDCLYLRNAAGLIAAAQMGVLEIHIWGSRIDDVDKPDRMVFDLDPDPAVDFGAVKSAAHRLRDALGALELESFALLTGGKGIHVIVPLVRRRGWNDVKRFAAALARRMAADAPERYVATMSKAKRKGKIFIDYLRNDAFATAIAPYSTRARSGAPLACPVTWRELDGISSAAHITVADARTRLMRADPWQGYDSARQSLKAAAFRALEL